MNWRKIINRTITIYSRLVLVCGAPVRGLHWSRYPTRMGCLRLNTRTPRKCEKLNLPSPRLLVVLAQTAPIIKRSLKSKCCHRRFNKPHYPKRKACNHICLVVSAFFISLPLIMKANFFPKRFLDQRKTENLLLVVCYLQSAAKVPLGLCFLFPWT